MSGADTERQKFKRWLDSQPGHRGRDIPEHIFDQIYPVANGITQQIWGRPPTFQQMQDLHDAGAHTPQAIHAMYEALPHPHAPALAVGEYGAYANALQTYQQHSGKQQEQGHTQQRQGGAQ